jgi:TetR/AcrR family transcriptional repressor of nem operon
MSQASNTREQIIDKAFQLMLQRGLNGFSYRDISQPLGIKNAAIHYHFPNKMDLIKALIEENQQVLRKSTAEFMAYGGPARPQLEGLFAYTLHQCKCGRPICMVGALAIDYDELPEDIKRANDQFMKDSNDWLTRVLEAGRKQKEFNFAGEPRTKAMSILATIQGARQLARVHGMDILEVLFDQIRIDLGIKQ